MGATISEFVTNSEIKTTGTVQSKYKIILAWNLMNQTSVVGIIPDSEEDVAMVLYMAVNIIPSTIVGGQY